MHLQSPLPFYILMLATGLSAALVIISWKRRRAPGSAAMAWIMAGCAIWCFTVGLQMLFTDLYVKALIDALSYAGILIIPAAWLVFSLQYTGYGQWVTRRLILLLMIEPLLTAAALASNSQHQLFYTARELVWIEGHAYLVLVHGPLFWVNTVYIYGLLLAGSFFVVRYILGTPGLYRLQVAALLIALATPWAGNVFYLLGLVPLPGLDFTPLAFTLSGLTIILGVYRYHLLDLTPITRNALIEMLEDGLVVVDEKNRVVDINPTACRLLRCNAREVVGGPAELAFKNCLEQYQRFSELSDTREKVQCEVNGQTQEFDLRITSLNDRLGKPAGKLVLWHTITSAEKIQEALSDSETRYRLLVEASPDAIVVTDLRGRLVFYNRIAAQMLGVPQEETLRNVSIYHFVLPADRKVVISNAQRALESARLQQFECTCQGSDGRVFPSEVRLITLRDLENNPTGFISVLRDVTARKQNEAEMLRAVNAERKQREIADALREIGAVLNSSLDTDAVLDSMLEQVARVVPFDSGNITLVRGEKAVIARSRGYEKFGVDNLTVVRDFVFKLEDTENFRWIREHKTPLIIADTQKYPGWVKLEATSYIRSWIGAPIIAQGEVVAFFSLDKAEPDFYQPEHGRILELFAGQAALAMRNASLYKETSELLSREQHLSEMLRKIGNSLEFSQVTEDILRLGVDLLGADGGTLGLLNDNRTSIAITHLYGVKIAEVYTSVSVGEGLTWEVIRSGKPLLVNDYASHPKGRTEIRASGVRSVLIVPVYFGEELIGVLGFHNTTEDKIFNPRDIPLAETIGRQAGVAIQNARLFSNAHRRAEEAETLRQASNAITSALKLDRVLEEIFTHLERVVPYDSCAIFLQEEDRLKVVAARGFPDQQKVLGMSLPVSNPLTQEGFRTRKAIVLADAQTDERFQGLGDAKHIHGWIGIPLLARGTLTGYLTIDSRKPNAYTENDGSLAQVFANQAAIAIENARLFEKVQHLAISDPLTELFNRRHFFELGRREFYRARRYGKPLSLLIMDVDDLKLVNDTYGHQMGDQVIEFIARQCQNQLRQADIPARYAGDEFIILLPETDLTGARNVATRIKNAVVYHQQLEEENVPVSISIGVSSLDASCYSLEILINRADQALYSAKQAGKTQICIWEEASFNLVSEE